MFYYKSPACGNCKVAVEQNKTNNTNRETSNINHETTCTAKQLLGSTTHKRCIDNFPSNTTKTVDIRTEYTITVRFIFDSISKILHGLSKIYMYKL